MVTCKRLKNHGRANVIYNFVKGYSKMRADGSDSLIPMSRMPMGLIEHVSNFFIADSLQEVKFVK